jgi:hypothetical protein
LAPRATESNQFDGPVGISVDAARKICVAETFNSRVVRINATIGAGWIT